ncbi:MAG TPA: hypothetical protein DCS43_11470 [Verrucomicrobia bacterium]|nr:hypothetical protein [Verrucomicrobiota bacterium]
MEIFKTRRKRNRKKRVEGNLGPVPFASFVLCMGIAGMAYVWILSRSEAIGVEIKALEAVASDLEEKHLNEELKWTRLCAPHNIERILNRNGVKMGYPTGRQVVLLADAGVWESGMDHLDRDMADESHYAKVSGTERHE